MRFFFVSVFSNIKRAFKPSMLIPVVLLAASLFIGGYIQKELMLQVAVGVYFENQSDISKEIIENLGMFSNIRIKHYSTKSDMLDDIVAVKIECGYVFDKDIDKYIESGSINRAAKLYKSDATVGDGFTNELVFAALTKTAAPYISANYLNGKTNMGYNDILEEAKSVTQSYYDSGMFLDINVNTVGERSSVSADNRINTGVVSVFLFILFFYITIGGVQEKKSGVCEKLTSRYGLLYITSYITSYALLIFTAASVLFAPGGYALHTVFVLGIYIAVLALISFAAIILFKSAYTLYALFPVVSIAVILLGGAFFDVSSISPALGKISHIFPTYYFCIYM